MKCAEKEDLQQKCTAAWNTYETATTELGLSVSGSGAIWPPPITGLPAMPWMVKALKALGQAIDPATGRLRPPYQAVVGLRWEHLKASMALSRHLSTHRC
jgi:hypothetical protein